MRSSLPLFFGIFVVMALSNAIVPVLPSYAPGSALQGAVYSAYFLGAFLITLPAGILSDRYGRIPLLRTGLILTLASGLLLLAYPQPAAVIVSRFLEGIGGGCFVAAAMAFVNSRPDHRKESGILMAMLNGGLVTGLALSGWLAVFFKNSSYGILVFAALTVIPTTAMLLDRRPSAGNTGGGTGFIYPFVRDNCMIWYASIVLVGTTGVVASLYPQFSGMSPDLAGIWIAAMSVSTIVSVLVASNFTGNPVRVIRWSAVLMAVGVGVTFFSPAGFIVIGAIAGCVMIAIMAALSGQREQQGILMGLFSTSSYLGMALLPFAAGLIADSSGFPWAFLVTALLALTVAFTIGRCSSSCTGTTQENKKQYIHQR